MLSVAEDHGVTVVHGDALFDAWARDGLTPSGLFWDDLHPTRAGHRLLGQAVAYAVAAQLGLDPTPWSAQPTAASLGLDGPN